MTDLDGCGRHTGELEKYIEDDKIAPKLVQIRSDFARREALRRFYVAKNAEDFYFEEVLNDFLALAQYPLNFAVFAEGKGDPEFQTHFCADKKQEAMFLAALKKAEGGWAVMPKSSMFRLFPDLLTTRKYYLVIFHLDTKTSDFTHVRPSKSCFPETKEQELARGFEAETPTIGDSETYVASCADFFFQFKWDVFTSEFANNAGEYLSCSLKRLVEGRHSWKTRDADLREHLIDTVFPDPGEDEWVRTLETIFSSVIRDFASGLGLVSAIMKELDTGRPVTPKDHPPNMFLAYRMFSREVGKGRHRDGDEHSAYLYDTAFLIPEALRAPYRVLLEKIKADRRDAEHAFETGAAPSISEAYEGPKRRRRLYGNIECTGENAEQSARTLGVMDEDFWNTLKSHDGPQKCVEILSKPVGNKIRSLADPVYHTGLTHTNHLFRGGGLELLGQLGEVDIKSFDEVPHNCHDDVRRLVILYYILCELIDWGGPEARFDPSNVAAVLIPIRMRGAVWGVSIHGIYTPRYERIFADQRCWQGYFKLTTDHRTKSTILFDRYLWGLAEQRVIDQVSDHLSRQLHGQGGDFDGAAEDISFDLRCTGRMSPFAFPKLEFRGTPCPNGNSVRFPPNSDQDYWLCWDIEDNAFFTARQPWDGQATRNFISAVSYGMALAYLNRAGNGPR
ncbi:MAG: hypothetical protein AAFY35_12130 [Pseudomonadota bacterium]